jgi:Tfp pilus assembly protein FimT
MADKALTLVEMVIGLAITAILVATSLVSFNFVDGRRLDTQARNMVSDLIWIRESAASRHNNYTVGFDITNETYSFFNGTAMIPANLVRRQRLTVNLASVKDWDGNAITRFTFFAPQGNASVTALINLTQAGKWRVINVSDETGFVRINNNSE